MFDSVEDKSLDKGSMEINQVKLEVLEKLVELEEHIKIGNAKLEFEQGKESVESEGKIYIRNQHKGSQIYKNLVIYLIKGNTNNNDEIRYFIEREGK